MSEAARNAFTALQSAYTGERGFPSIVSGYRTPEQNDAVKGAKSSEHLSGNAYDINTTGWTPEEKLALMNQAWDAGFRGFGAYDNNLHLDVGSPRMWGPDFHRGSIPEWAMPFAQERYGYADGGEVTDLGQVREQKQLQAFTRT